MISSSVSFKQEVLCWGGKPEILNPTNTNPTKFYLQACSDPYFNTLVQESESASLGVIFFKGLIFCKLKFHDFTTSRRHL